MEVVLCDPIYASELARKLRPLGGAALCVVQTFLPAFERLLEYGEVFWENDMPYRNPLKAKAAERSVVLSMKIGSSCFLA